MTSLMDMRKGALLAKTVSEERDEALAAFRVLAAELGVHLLIGSLPIRVSEEKCANRSFLLAPGGVIAARYDKIHMFDVAVGDGQHYRESAKFEPGRDTVLAEVGPLTLGLTVCYDLRFPHLYRALAKLGATVLCVPAAFTQVTGEAHWHVLLRARAIENGAYVIAPAQGGRHADGRQTYGHSLVVGPWGEILAEAGTEPAVLLAELDPAAVTEARRKIPSLAYDRPIRPPASSGLKPGAINS
jgi:predicted amidohydrolase